MRMNLHYLFFVLLIFTTQSLYASIIEDPIVQNEWIPEGLQKAIKSFPNAEQKLEAEFETTVQVTAECRYPHLYGDSLLIDHVNRKLEATSKELFESFVEYEQTTQEEYDQGFGGCALVVDLFPVYNLPNLISIYGYEFQHKACPHGWTHYMGKNFWKHENTIIELKLEDVFIKGSDWCNFLLHYCEKYFRFVGYGYYGDGYEITPDLEANDLDIFVLTEQGLMIIFRSYTVWGWADGPGVITIPYRDLKGFIDPAGPLKEIPGISV